MEPNTKRTSVNVNCANCDIRSLGECGSDGLICSFAVDQTEQKKKFTI